MAEALSMFREGIVQANEAAAEKAREQKEKQRQAAVIDQLTRDAIPAAYLPVASSTSLPMVLMLRAVPFAAAGIFSFERPMPEPKATYISRFAEHNLFVLPSLDTLQGIGGRRLIEEDRDRAIRRRLRKWIGFQNRRHLFRAADDHPDRLAGIGREPPLQRSFHPAGG